MPERKKRTVKFTLAEMVSLAMLSALYVVMNRFVSVSAWNINFSFAFIATVTAAFMFGMHGGAVVGALGDFIGAIAFPKGAYFPGFTVSAAIIGIIYGFAARKSKKTWPVLIAAVVSQLVSSLFLNSIWISVLYGADFKATLVSRLPQFAIMTAIQMVIAPMIFKVTERIKKSSALLKAA